MSNNNKIKFHHIDHSTPLTHRVKKFSTYDEMMDVIDINRKVERVYIKDFYSFDYVPSEGVYKLSCEVAEGYDKDSKKYEDISDGVLDCPAYSFAQLTRDILFLGDLCKLVNISYQTDGMMPKAWTKDGMSRIKNTVNIDMINDIMVNNWEYTRTRNKHTSPVICHRVFDFATISPDGDGRCIVTGKYIHQKDKDVMKMGYDRAREINGDIVFKDGQASALTTRANFVTQNTVLANDEPTLVGFSILNSEFKKSQYVANGYLFLPEREIELIGTTANLRFEHKHIGDKKIFEALIKRGINEILGKGEIFTELFNNLSTCKSRGLAIDFGAKQENDNIALGAQLKMSNKMKDLIQIKKTKGYPDTIKGVVFTLMDYATNTVVSEDERLRVNSKIMEILHQPDVFVSRLTTRIESRADVIEFDDEQQQNSITEYT